MVAQLESIEVSCVSVGAAKAWEIADSPEATGSSQEMKMQQVVARLERHVVLACKSSGDDPNVNYPSMWI